MPDAKEGMQRVGSVVTIEVHVPAGLSPEEIAKATVKWMNSTGLKSYQQMLRDELQTIDAIVPKAEMQLYLLDPKEAPPKPSTEKKEKSLIQKP